MDAIKKRSGIFVSWILQICNILRCNSKFMASLKAWVNVSTTFFATKMSVKMLGAYAEGLRL